MVVNDESAQEDSAESFSEATDTETSVLFGQRLTQALFNDGKGAEGLSDTEDSSVLFGTQLSSSLFNFGDADESDHFEPDGEVAGALRGALEIMENQTVPDGFNTIENFADGSHLFIPDPDGLEAFDIKQEFSQVQGKSASTSDKNEHNTANEGKRRTRAVRCGTCATCIRPDCGQCSNCRDKRKFGGPGIKKRACTARKCLRLQSAEERLRFEAEEHGKADQQMAPEPTPTKHTQQPQQPQLQESPLLRVSEGGLLSISAEQVADDFLADHIKPLKTELKDPEDLQLPGVEQLLQPGQLLGGLQPGSAAAMLLGQKLPALAGLSEPASSGLATNDGVENMNAAAAAAAAELVYTQLQHMVQTLAEQAGTPAQVLASMVQNMQNKTPFFPNLPLTPPSQAAAVSAALTAISVCDPSSTATAPADAGPAAVATVPSLVTDNSSEPLASAMQSHFRGALGGSLLGGAEALSTGAPSETEGDSAVPKRATGSRAPQYRCGRCGALKRGHKCNGATSGDSFPKRQKTDENHHLNLEPTSDPSSMDPSSDDSTFSIMASIVGGSSATTTDNSDASKPAVWELPKMQMEGEEGEQDNGKRTVSMWTPEEHQAVYNAVRKHGFKWHLVASEIPGRSESAVRNRWHRLEQALQDHPNKAAPSNDPAPTNSATYSYKCGRCGRPKKGHVCHIDDIFKLDTMAQGAMVSPTI